MRRAAFALLAVAALAGCGGSKALKPASPLPAVVVRSPSTGTWVRLLRSTGWSARPGTLSDLTSARTAAIVPGDAALTKADLEAVAAWVGGGGRVVTANDALLARLGVKRDGGRSHTGAGGAVWAKALAFRPLTGVEAVVHAKPDGGIVVGETRRGSGLVFALAFDPAVAGQGYEYLPTLPDLIGRDVGVPVGPKAQAAEVFVDPGGLHDGLKGSPQKIADLVARSGARIADVAGWNYDFTDPQNNDDYTALIDALHARGVLAYAWLEPPFVTLALWQSHPECRERTKTGRSVVDWRSLVQLYNPHCMRLAEESWHRLLTRHPWDGVNVAELYFEPDIRDSNFTPFSKDALRLFGKDPDTHRAEFFAWRTRLVTQLNDQVLRFLNGLPNAQHLGLELTVIDDELDPELGRQVGSDVAALAQVAERNGASLVVEDPFTSWTDGPLRYDRLGPHVAGLMPAGASAIDVNVVPRERARPTSQMEGAELGLAIASATAQLGRVAIYSLGTLTGGDLDLLPGAMAGSTSTTDLGVYGKWTVKVTAPSSGDTRLQVDGIDWPTANGVAIVPAGNHTLQWSTGKASGPGLVGFGGQLGTARVTPASLTLTYDARPDAYALVTRRPTSLTVDGKPAKLEVEGTYAVRLPTGRHRAVLGFG